MRPTNARRRRATFLRRARRGNTLILTAGILVLLVIIASAYITRTQAGRTTARALRDAEMRTTAATAIADALARELADDLFAYPIDPAAERTWTLPPDSTYLNRNPARSSVPRIAPAPGAERWGMDWVDVVNNQTGAAPADGIPDHPYNLSRYEIIPYTNWPDNITGSATQRPWPENLRGTSSWTIDSWEGNPFGNPGFGDHRWLADSEPLRWNADGDGLGLTDAFKYWRHMSYIARANNQWRLCRDISDIYDYDGDGTGGLLTNGGHADPRQDLDQLRAPVEQWLVSVQPDLRHFSLAGDAIYFGGAMGWENDFDGDGHPEFIDRWQDWFLIGESSSTIYGYPYAYSRPELIPPNLYHLKDLDGDRFYLEDGERPSDEFVPGSARWNVGRVLADADGDGFTDSFWFFDPTPVSAGVRRIVAVRIVDNGAMINANVATRFHPGSTGGETPADVALIGQARDFQDGLMPVPDNWNVGFLDAYLNREYFAAAPGRPFPHGGALYRPGSYDVRWESGLWLDFLDLVGVAYRPDNRFDDLLLDPYERLDYWLNHGSQPFLATGGLQPFGIADELELRMYHGQNYPWIYSRFERAVNYENDTAVLPHAFLRSSSNSFQETTPYLDQLDSTELLADRRRMITLYNGARNDLLPPWLRWRWRNDPSTDPVNEYYPADLESWGNFIAIRNFEAQKHRKLDLREVLPEFDGPHSIPTPQDRQGRFLLHERLPWVLTHVFADGDSEGSLNRPVNTTPAPGFEGKSIFDEYVGNGTGLATTEQDEIRRLAAGFAANILAARDADDDAPVESTRADLTYSTLRHQIGSIPLPEWGTLIDNTRFETQYLGLERQPYIGEVFVAHVYGSTFLPIGGGVQPEGEHIVDQNAPQTTVVAVQIINPFNYPLGHPLYGTGINLANYRLRVVGNDVELPNAFLLPGTESEPNSAIFVSVVTDFDGDNTFGARMVDFLDIATTDLSPNSLVYDVATLVGSWPMTRTPYDTFTGDHPVELIRLDPDTLLPLNQREVVVDRIDQAFETSQQLGVELSGLPRPPIPGVFGGIANGVQIGDEQHWAQWARVARPWGDDRLNFDISNPATHGIQGDQSGPRFVNAKQFLTRSDRSQDVMQNGNPIGPYRGSPFTIANLPDGAVGTPPWFDRALVSQPWQEYFTLIGTTEPLRRKPTFFNMNVVFDATGYDLYPAYNDAVYGYGQYFYGSPPGPTTGLPIPDKGAYHRAVKQDFAHQDRDFHTVGELFRVFLFGHELNMVDAGGGAYRYNGTERTFSENLFEQEGGPLQGGLLVGGELIGTPLDTVTDANLLRRDMANGQPAMRAGHRIYEAFVCDGYGVNPGDLAGNYYRFGNAQGFTGQGTPGMINLSTAPVEVMRTLPNWSKPVYADLATLEGAGGPAIIAQLRRSALPEAIDNYRERLNGNPVPADPQYGSTFGIPNGPDYSDDRGTGSLELRDERGLAGIGELRELRKDASQPWDPFNGAQGEEMRVETDAWTFNQDDVDQIVKASNIVTTTSDVFTVYFKVRTFRQRPDGFWDATDPEQIVDDSRYVMIVDRSQVNHPNDQPRIIHLEKLPN